MNLSSLVSDLQSLANPAKAKDLKWFFKTGPGQYGAGDQFIGIIVPDIRKLVKLYWDVLDLSEVEILLHNPIHEFRLTALLILVKKLSAAKSARGGYSQSKENIYQFYLTNLKYINNWDLVDLSSRDIIGAYCFEHQNYSILTKLSQSNDLWEKRIAIVSTYFLIKRGIFSPTLTISLILLNDSHDLIHKAVGWMLREVGNRDQKILTDFLDRHCLKMPRTALRYAIEKFPDPLRFHYLHQRAG
ncbi:MAG: DNA alkylation repair protein [Candidatus Shapirobacteria bacterium]|nr:DNA alkylation repair protein [Candidatus Shapirobacteria bacterium]